MRILRVIVGLAVALALLAWPAAATLPEQSPIDVRSRQAQPAHLPVLHFDYDRGPLHLQYVRKDAGDPDGCSVRHHEEAIDGHTEHAELRVAGVTYELVNVHWHTPSEHRLDGVRYPLEQHLVHRAADGRLLVVGVFWRVGPANAELGRIFAALPAECGPATEVAHVDLDRLVPRHSRTYRYPGSLTTAPYTEGVSWVVMDQPMTASAAQLHRMRSLFPEGNARDVQPLNGRVVRTER